MLPPTIKTAPTSEIVRPNGQHRGQDRVARDRQKHPDRPRSGCAIDTQCAAVFLPRLLDRTMRQGGDDRCSEKRLCDDHGAGRKQKRKRTQRPRARQHQVEREAYDNRGQTKERIREQDQKSATGEPADCQSRPARQSDNGGYGRSGKTNRQGKSDVMGEFSRSERGPDVNHLAGTGLHAPKLPPQRKAPDALPRWRYDEATKSGSPRWHTRSRNDG